MSDTASADAAEAAFYDAFATGDHPRMMRIWAPDDDIVCIHPMGPRLIGRELIAISWRHILNNETFHHFDLHVKSKWQSETLAVHVLDEVISLDGNSSGVRPVLATNVYRRIGPNWHMVAHHAGIDAHEDLAARAPRDSATRH